ncbi:MAG: hypothetical protein RBR19_09865 [Sedimentisphaerales bacterium]|jgi:hypothetical protein|nr:hypothetical protein [Sedimentisphaerales bacterium]
MNVPIPDGWGNDPLSKFMADAYHNCVASFVNYARLPVMTAVREVDACFRDALRISFKRKKELFLPAFIGRCHAAYLSGIQLSMGGQVPEAYPMVRLCIENALYALFMQDDPTIDDAIPERWKIWLERDEGEAAGKRCRATFAYGKVRDHLASRDAALGECADKLYQWTIAYGAHPNFYGQAQASQLFSKEGGNVQYLLPDTTACKACIQTAVEGGMCALGAFGLALGERYEKAGIPAKIKRLDWPMQKAESKGGL